MSKRLPKVQAGAAGALKVTLPPDVVRLLEWYMAERETYGAEDFAVRASAAVRDLVRGAIAREAAEVARQLGAYCKARTGKDPGAVLDIILRPESVSG